MIKENIGFEQNYMIKSLLKKLDYIFNKTRRDFV